MFAKRSDYKPNFNHDLFPRLNLERVPGPDGKRHYQTPSGAVYPSVTTVLAQQDDTTSLDKWKKRVGEEKADKISRQATHRGSALHAVLEKYVLNEQHFLDGTMPTTRALFNSIKPLVDRFQVIRGVEMPVYSDTLKTAGTLDLIGDLDGRLTVGDFKTASKPKDEKWIKNYFLQITCYAMMVEDLHEVEVHGGAIMIAVDHDQPQLFTFDIDAYRDQVSQIFVWNRIDEQSLRV